MLEKIRRNQHNLAQSSNQNNKGAYGESQNNDYLDTSALVPGTPAAGKRRAASTSMSTANGAVDPKSLYKTQGKNVAAQSLRPVSSHQASRMMIQQQRNTNSGQGNRSALAMLSPVGEKAVSNKGEINLETEGQNIGTTQETTQGQAEYTVSKGRVKKPRAFLEPSLDISPQIFPFAL